MKKVELMSTSIPKKYIFCYLDILGYKTLVDKCFVDPTLIENIRSSFKNIFYDMIADFKHEKSESEVQTDFETIMKSIKVSLISDTILIRMPIEDTKMLSHGLGEKFNTLSYIQVFIYFVSLLFIGFSTKVGYFFRGGISINEHYEDDFNGNGLFITSKALINSYLLEKEADVIRILIHDNVLSFISNDYDEEHKKEFSKIYLYQDSTNRNCLNIYFVLRNDELTRSALDGIREVIKLQMNANRNDVHVLEKYNYFIQYHNKFVNGVFNMPEYTID